MNPTRPRLLARFREDEPIEVYRGAPNTYLSEGCVRSMTEQMGEGWRHWIERPIADHEAIGGITSPDTRTSCSRGATQATVPMLERVGGREAGLPEAALRALSRHIPVGGLRDHQPDDIERGVKATGSHQTNERTPFFVVAGEGVRLGPVFVGY